MGEIDQSSTKKDVQQDDLKGQRHIRFLEIVHLPSSLLHTYIDRYIFIKRKKSKRYIYHAAAVIISCPLFKIADSSLEDLTNAGGATLDSTRFMNSAIAS